MQTDTIAAISTAPADGAISIIRLSGPQAIEIADSVFSGSLSQAQSHTVSYGFVKDGEKPVDEVLVSLFRAPRSYTTEDIVEINSHGGIYVTRRILSLLLRAGARLARPGEFTQRAVLNGRIDLSQAEAVEQMIEADNEAAMSLALRGIRGSVSRKIRPLIDQLTEIIAQIEVNIDYPEYDIEQLTVPSMLPLAEDLVEQMDSLLRDARRSQLIRKGIDTVIAGKPNVGKSSLLNALLEEEKAIVTDIEGTTRDLVEGKIQVGSVRLNLVDTAGIRDSSHPVEKIGIEKSQQKIAESDLLLLVLDGSRPLDEQDLSLLDQTKGMNRIILVNKNDLPRVIDLPEGAIEIEAETGKIEPLVRELERRFEAGSIQDSDSLGTLRQIGLLENAREDMMRAIETMEIDPEPDLAEIDLLSALDHLKEIIGKGGRDDLLDTLFSTFCLGK